MHELLSVLSAGSTAQIAIAALAFGFMGLLGLVLRNFDSTIKEQNKATKELTNAVTSLQLIVAKEYCPLPMHAAFAKRTDEQFAEVYEKVSDTRDRVSRIEGKLGALT